MTRFLFRTAVLAVAVAAALPAAWADEKPSALERLSVEERQRLESHVPGWNDLAPERQERIAANLLKVRRLPPEERARLTRRIEQLERHRPHGKRLGDFRDPHRRRELWRRGHLVRAAGLVLQDHLSKEGTAALKQTLGSRGGRSVEMAFYRRFWDALARRKAAEEGIAEVALPANLPEPLRRHAEKWKEQAAAGDAKAKQRLAHMILARETHQIVKQLEKAGALDEATLRRVGAALRERHPEAFEEARAELEEVALDPESLKRYVRRGQPTRGPGRRGPPGKEASLEERARYLRDAIDHAGPVFQRHPELRAPALRLREALTALIGGRADDGGAGRGRRPAWHPPGGKRRPGSGPGMRGPRRGRPPAPPDEAPPKRDEGPDDAGDEEEK